MHLVVRLLTSWESLLLVYVMLDAKLLPFMNHVETYHIGIKEAQALQPDRTETSSCVLAKAMRDAHPLLQVLLWSALVFI
jgi:hypothetical protein